MVVEVENGFDELRTKDRDRGGGGTVTARIEHRYGKVHNQIKFKSCF